jgi:phosphatidylinositol kinase/protein kinase (PI-3  family)
MELDRAWDIYYGVFKKVEKQLPQLTTLDLQYVSPSLLTSRRLDLAVPGRFACFRVEPFSQYANRHVSERKTGGKNRLICDEASSYCV